jgi:hypothetical protein
MKSKKYLRILFSVRFLFLKAAPWLRWLVIGLSLWRLGFGPESIHVGLVVDRVALGQVFPRVLPFSPVIIIPPWLSMLISYVDEQ